MKSQETNSADFLNLLDRDKLTEIEHRLLLESLSTGFHDESDELRDLARVLRKAVSVGSSQDENAEIDDAFRREVETRARRILVDETICSSHTAPSSPLNLETILEPPVIPGDLGMLGPYRIIRLIGQGGMGMVFEAVDTKLQRRTAIKLMLPNMAASSVNRERFLREAQSAAKVDHDHICPIYQVGEQQQTPFIVMPFLLGESLESKLQRAHIPLNEAICIGSQIAKGLSAAHGAGMVHRDIKTSNVWIEKKSDGSERARILDFGLARLEENDSLLTREGMIVGTPAYMSPEQARGQTVDARSDLFSLGVVLYEILTGQRPFRGDSATAVLSSLLLDQPIPPHTIFANIPVALSDLVLGLLSKSPGDRPANAQQIVVLLEGFGNDSTTATNAAPNTVTIADQPMDRASFESRVSSVSSKQRSRSPVFIVLLIALGLFGLAASASVILFTTKDGTLVIDADDEADIRLRQGEVQIYDSEGKLKYKLTPGQMSQALSDGNYIVKVEGVDGVQLSTSKFEMKQAGKVIITATARASEPKQISTIERDSPKHVPSDPDLFPGRIVISGAYRMDGINLSPIASISDAAPNSKSTPVIHLTECKPGDVASINILPRLASGAFAIRCHAKNGSPFLNFRGRNRDDKSRWLSLISNNPTLRFVLQRHDYEGGSWQPKQGTVLAKSNPADVGWDAEQGIELIGRWSETDYDLWINRKYFVGGEIEALELFRGNEGPVQLGVAAIQTGDLQLWIDEIVVWDQSELTPSNAQSKNLPSRPAGRPIR